jgi:hypothetical protein
MIDPGFVLIDRSPFFSEFAAQFQSKNTFKNN